MNTTKLVTISPLKEFTASKNKNQAENSFLQCIIYSQYKTDIEN